MGCRPWWVPTWKPGAELLSVRSAAPAAEMWILATRDILAMLVGAVLLAVALTGALIVLAGAALA